MFNVDLAGLVELEGGRPPHRLIYEPIANVFDEFRGYTEGRKRPSYCCVKLEHQANPRGVLVTVADDGAGFANESDIWTLFGTTAKRNNPGVAGRFNMGDKQFVAVARTATIKTGNVTVEFDPSKPQAEQRKVTRHRTEQPGGTIVEALMPWSVQDMAQLRDQLRKVRPPQGLAYRLDGELIEQPRDRHTVRVTLPTVKLLDGVMRPSSAKTSVAIFDAGSEPMLYELGIPVCSLAASEFPWSLDVGQKVPLSSSRDAVSPAYINRLIGLVMEQAAMDGFTLVSDEDEGAPFIKGALDWIEDPNALKATVDSIYGADAVRLSSDPVANAQAAAQGVRVISGRTFGEDTRRRMEQANILPTSKDKFGGVESLKPAAEVAKTCPHCGKAI